MINVLLLTPPVCEPTQPGLAGPTLSAALQQADFQVIQRDLAIESFHWLMSPINYENAIRQLQKLIIEESFSSDEAIRRQAISALHKGRVITDYLQEAKAVFKDASKFYNFQLYKWAYQVFQNALQLYSFAYYPTRISYFEYDMVVPWSSENITAHLQARESNIFHTFFKEHILPEISYISPDLIGLSITYKSQLLPGFTLAKLLFESIPETKIVIGGAYLTAIADRLHYFKVLDEICDGIVLYEGESAIVSIAKLVAEGKPLRSSEIVNFMIPGGKAPNNIHTESLTSPLTPDFSTINLDPYLVPELVLPVQSCRGCYWGKCTFCSVSKATGKTFRKKPLKLFIKELEELHLQYDANLFFICDDATDISTLIGLSKGLQNKGLEIGWATEARFEKNLTAEACSFLVDGGCLHLIFGFESADQRILNLMRKGTNIERTLQILKACKSCGLAVNLQSFIGFPGETTDEAIKTETFFRENNDLYLSLGLGHYMAMDGSVVSREPELFGVTLLPESEKLLLPWQEIEVLQEGSMNRSQTLQRYNSMMQNLRNDDLTGPGFLCGSSGSHGLLYLQKFGLRKVKILGEEAFRLTPDIEQARYTLSQNAVIENLEDGHVLIYLRNGGGSLIIRQITAEGLELLLKSPQTIPTLALTTLQKNDLEIYDELELLSKIILEFSYLARLGILLEFPAG